MLYLRISMAILVGIYTIPALFTSAFSSEANRGRSDPFELLLIWSPHLLLILSFVLPQIFPKLKQSLPVALLPLLSVGLYFVYLQVVLHKNKDYEISVLKAHREANAGYLSLFPLNTMQAKPENYIVRNLVVEPERKIFLVGLQMPLSELRDVWGNRTMSVGEPQLQLWLYLAEHGKVEIVDSGLINGIWVNENNFSNVGYYAKNGLAAATEDEGATTVLPFQRVDSVIEIRLNLSTLPKIRVGSEGNRKEIPFSELGSAL